MTLYACRDCTESRSGVPGVIPAGWTPQWIEAPQYGAYTFAVRWCCPSCSTEIEAAQRSWPKMICHGCFEGYSRHPAEAVPCPQCKASAAHNCVRPSGHNVFGGDVHTDREKLALEEGLMHKCQHPLEDEAPQTSLF